jgi:hypothetical protein
MGVHPWPSLTYNTCTLPRQGPASQETTGEHRWDVSPALVTLEAYCSTHGRNSPSHLSGWIPSIFSSCSSWSALYLGNPRIWTVTHACALTEQEVLLLKLWLSTLIIPVQTPLWGHAPTTIPPTQCAFIMVSISVLIPSIALGSNC